jgi:hypothetical protein
MILENALVSLRLPLTLGLVISGLRAIQVRGIRATKESNAARQSVQDRREMLQNLGFAVLTNLNCVRSVLATPANRSDFCEEAVEVVRISAHPVANGVTQLTRFPDGTVTIDSVVSNLGNALIKIHISTSSKVVGVRGPSAQTSIVISNQQAFTPVFTGFSRLSRE